MTGSRSVVALSVVSLALGACGTRAGATVRTSPATAEQRQRFGLAEGTRVLLALDSSRDRAGRGVGSFTAPARYSLTAACDGERNVTVSTSTVGGGRETGGSYEFGCRRSPIAAPRNGKAGARVDVDVFDNGAGTWAVLFFVPPGG